MILLVAAYALLPGSATFCRSVADMSRALFRSRNLGLHEIRIAYQREAYWLVAWAARETPVDARILIPEGSEHMPLSSAFWCAYYLYPRRLVQLSDLKPGPLPEQVDYIMVHKGWGLNLTGVPADSIKGTENEVLRLTASAPVPPGRNDLGAPQERRLLLSWLIPGLALIAGMLVVTRLRPGLTMAETLGLSMLGGIGGLGTLIFLAAFLNLPLRPALVFGIVGVTAAVGFLFFRRPAGGEPDDGRASPSASRAASLRATLASWAPAETLAMLLLAGLVAVSVWAACLHPIIAMDAHSYDGRARWIAAEGKLDISAYQALNVSGESNLSYPPVFPISLALAYLGGGGQGKVIDSFYFVGVLLLFYSALRRLVPRLGALLGCLLLASTPNIWNHASLGLTNLPAMAFLTGGMFLALTKRWLAAGLLLAFAAGVRSDAVVLSILMSLVIVACDAKQCGWREAGRRLSLLIGPALVLTFAWQFYLKDRLELSNADPFRSSFLPDVNAVATGFKGLGFLFNPTIYGWGGFALILGAILTLTGPTRRSTPDESSSSATWLLLLALVAAAAVGLIGLYQQLDPRFGGGRAEILNTSFKRQLFYLVPGIIAAALAAPGLRRLIAAIDRWQRT